MLQVQVMWPQAGGSIHHACWLSTSHAYELMAPLGDQEVELPPIYLTEPLWGGNKGMDRKELILLLSLLPSVYVHAFFSFFWVILKEWQFSTWMPRCCCVLKGCRTCKQFINKQCAPFGQLFHPNDSQNNTLHWAIFSWLARKWELYIIHMLVQTNFSL